MALNMWYKFQMRFLVSAIILINCSIVYARPTETVSNKATVKTLKQAVAIANADQTADLLDALLKISKQAAVTFVVEGSISQLALGQDATSTSSDATPLFLRASNLASLYDYKAEQMGNIILFRRQYSTPHDLPFVSLNEAISTLQDINKITSKFDVTNVDSAKTPYIERLFLSMTPEQSKKFNNGALSYASLNLTQKNVVDHLLMDIYLSSKTHSINPAINTLQEISSSGVCVQKESLTENSTTLMLGYRNRLAKSSSNNFVPLLPLSYGNKPLNENNLLAKQPKPEKDSEYVEALSELVAECDKTNRYKTFIEPGLATIPITVIGASHSSPVLVLIAAAKVNGLDAYYDSPEHLYVSRTKVTMPTNLSEMPKAILESIPEPLLNAMHISEYNTLSNNLMSSPSTVENIKMLSKLERYPNQVAANAATSLLASLGKKLTDVSPNTVSASTLSEHEKADIAVLILAQCLKDIIPLTNDRIPTYLTNRNSLFLKGKTGMSEDGRKYVAISFLRTDPASSRIDDIAGYTHFESP